MLSVVACRLPGQSIVIFTVSLRLIGWLNRQKMEPVMYKNTNVLKHFLVNINLQGSFLQFSEKMCDGWMDGWLKENHCSDRCYMWRPNWSLHIWEVLVFFLEFRYRFLSSWDFLWQKESAWTLDTSTPFSTFGPNEEIELTDLLFY